MRLFSKRLYHGTPHAFDKFDTEHIGTGEGAQVHGWGLYFAENKDIAEQYKNHLTSRPQYKISIDGKEIIVDKSKINTELQNLHVPEFMIPTLNDEFQEDVLRRIASLEKLISEDEVIANKEYYAYGFNSYMTRFEALQRYKEILDWVNEHNYDITPIHNKLITVEIPDDLVFAEENESIKEQPEQVIEALEQITYEDIFKSVEVYKIPRDPSIYEDVETIIKKYVPSYEYKDHKYALSKMIRIFNVWYDFDNLRIPPSIDFISNQLKTICYYYLDVSDDVNWDDLAKDILNFANKYKHAEIVCKWSSFKDFYYEYTNEVSPKEASLKLESLGVNGIHYDGREDGSCYVIFNPKYLKIVEVE